MTIKIKKAIISVSDKSGLPEFAKFLDQRGVEILSTGGTLKTITDAGIKATSIGEYTGFPEIMDGRVKTLHPKIHGGLLALGDNENHIKALKDNDIESIDLLVVNLYPFAATTSKEDCSFEDAIENIDIGGPAMLRAGAKNYQFTAVVCDTNDYAKIMSEINKDDGVTKKTSLELSRKVFNHTASYDAMIAAYLNKQAEDDFPEKLTITYQKQQTLRYGENPHQSAAYYRPLVDLEKEKAKNLSGFEQLHGKELSFNNLLDTGASLRTALSLPRPGIAIIKHLNPCGAAMVERMDAKNDNLKEGELNNAFLVAKSCDPVSAFGGIIATASVIDEKTATSIVENFAEVIVASDYSKDALKILISKKNLRIIRVVDANRFLKGIMEIRTIPTGILYQNFDDKFLDPKDFVTVTKKKPDEKMLQSLAFAWRICKNVKSNAIIFTSDNATLGIGAGQMSRIDSVDIAVSKSKKAGLELKGSVAASDAFFPFRDGLDALAKAGAIAVVQPGGSIRDQEVIDAANEHGIVMVTTGMRHFLH